jgi:bacterial/archaeal transporter family-2 protein
VPAAAPAAAPTAGRLRGRGTGAALAAAAVAGAMVALQQRVNGELATELDDALATGLVSFATGLVAVAVVVLARPAARAAVAAVRQVPWWARLGGLGGATLVTVAAAAAPVTGIALLTVGLVAGQTTGGLLVDRAGLTPGGGHRLTPPRLAGAALCLVAVAVAVSGSTPDGAAGAPAGVVGSGAALAGPLLLALVVGAGLLAAVQQALNGRVRLATGSAAVATLLNFAVGGAALAAVVAVDTAVTGLPGGSWPGAGQWYLYIGGPLGAAFVAVAALVVRRLGVLRMGLALVAGQLLGALLLDLTVPVHGSGVAGLTVAGAALTLVAVAVSGRGGRRA